MMWPILYPCDTTEADPDLLAAADATASLMMWGLTGRRFGEWAITGERWRVYGCESTGAWRAVPYNGSDGERRNAVCGGGCCVVPLAHHPVRSVSEVRLDGAIVADDRYEVDAGVVRLYDGCPFCSDCGPAPIEVDYTAGFPVPTAGQYAAGEVACELLKGLEGGVCALSARAVSVARQGVQIQMEDASALLESGMTGLPLADAFIRAVNPHGLSRRSRAMSPDRMPGTSGQAVQVPQP